MQNKFFLILILILSFGLLKVSAQTTPPKTISGGVLNGKATELAKPQYPTAAKAANASGAVNVQVLVDENGDVVSATAVSGHPLLRQACEEAARAAKFAPTLLSGQPVKITGIIIYNFVLAMTFTQVGYELSLAEKTRLLNKYQLDSIGRTFPQNWLEEKEAVSKLNTLLIDKKTKEETPPKPASSSSDAPAMADKLTVKGDTMTFRSVSADTVGGMFDEKYTLGEDSLAVVKDLQSKLESRLSVNDNIIWSFRLGVILGKLKAEIDGDAEVRTNLSELNQLNTTKPAGISEPVAAQLKELIESSRQAISNAERTKQLTPLIESLRSLRGF